MKIDYENPPEKSREELERIYNEDMYLILDDVLKTPASYRIIFQDILDILKYGYTESEVRNHIQNFKIHADDKEIRGLPRKNFLSNMILWRYFVVSENVEEMDESYIFQFQNYTMDKLIDYLDDKILPNFDGGFDAVNVLLAEMSESMTAISRAFTPLMGLSVSDYDIAQIEKRNPELTQLMYEHIDPNAQPKEVEERNQYRIRRVMEIITNDSEYNHFKPMYAAGKVLSEGQSKEIFVRIGFKSDINGHTIPYPIDANFLIDGLSRPSYFYINSLSGRKAGILSKTKMSDPGSFSKQLNWVTASSGILRKDYEMCDSNRPIIYEIKDENFLMRLNGRYYYDDGEMKLLQYKQDHHLIGKTIPFRSPCTCNSKEGICKYCYGELFEINKDLFSVGSLAATKTGEPLGQSVLSTKHSQDTDSAEINLGTEFDKIFELTNGEVSISDTADIDDNCSIVFNNGVIFEESDDSELYYCTTFDLITADDEIVCHVEEENGANLIFSETMTALYKKAKDKTQPISLDNLDDGEILFNVEIANKEVMGPLKLIKSIIANKGHGGAKTIDEICQKFAETLWDCGIKYDLVHAETIIRALVRKKSDDTQFPDWGRNDDTEDYQLLHLLAAMQHNPSPIVRLSTGYMKKQLLSAGFYKAHGASHLDPLFVDCLADYVDPK